MNCVLLFLRVYEVYFFFPARVGGLEDAAQPRDPGGLLRVPFGRRVRLA